MKHRDLKAMLGYNGLEINYCLLTLLFSACNKKTQVGDYINVTINRS